VLILENIPKLYSAGECGSFWGWMYQGGSLLAECMATGPIAGRSTAAEKTWDS
jgi:succinate dehydrogenase/fumarate reductase flavoprotein subunit